MANIIAPNRIRWEIDGLNVDSTTPTHSEGTVITRAKVGIENASVLQAATKIPVSISPTGLVSKGRFVTPGIYACDVLCETDYGKDKNTLTFYVVE